MSCSMYVMAVQYGICKSSNVSHCNALQWFLFLFKAKENYATKYALYCSIGLRVVKSHTFSSFILGNLTFSEDFPGKLAIFPKQVWGPFRDGLINERPTVCHCPFFSFFSFDFFFCDPLPIIGHSLSERGGAPYSTVCHQLFPVTAK